MADYIVDGNPDFYSTNMKYLEWTSSPPEREGVYWVWLEGGKPEIVRLEFETFPNGGNPFSTLVIYNTKAGRFNEEPDTVRDYERYNPRWLGPLPHPEMPKGQG